MTTAQAEVAGVCVSIVRPDGTNDNHILSTAISSTVTPAASSTSETPSSSLASSAQANTSNSLATSVSAAPSTASTQSHETNIAPIVGGAVGGGVAAIIILGTIIWFYRRSIRSTRRGTFDTIEQPDRMDPASRILASPPPPPESKAVAPLSSPHMKLYVSVRVLCELTPFLTLTPHRTQGTRLHTRQMTCRPLRPIPALPQ